MNHNSFMLFLKHSSHSYFVITDVMQDVFEWARRISSPQLLAWRSPFSGSNGPSPVECSALSEGEPPCVAASSKDRPICQGSFRNKCISWDHLRDQESRSQKDKCLPEGHRPSRISMLLAAVFLIRVLFIFF